MELVLNVFFVYCHYNTFLNTCIVVCFILFCVTHLLLGLIFESAIIVMGKIIPGDKCSLHKHSKLSHNKTFKHNIQVVFSDPGSKFTQIKMTFSINLLC